MIHQPAPEKRKHHRRWQAVLTAGPATLLLLLALLTPLTPAAVADYDPNLIQVQLAGGASIAEVNATYGTTTADSLPPHYLLHVPVGIEAEALIALMLADPGTFVCVEHSFRDETPEGVRQMIVIAVGGTIGDYLDQNLVERIHLRDIQPYATGEGVLVAVLDTGVLASHEALAGVIAPGGYDFVAGDNDPTDESNGIDDDDDGFIDEGAGHGTLVAGIVHLVAPGAQILPIRVLDDEGHGTTFTLAKGIRYATELGANVINMSLGLTDRSGIIAHELAQARLHSAAMVAAAGNLNTDSLLYYPASDVKVMMVTALDSSDVKASFSSYHARVAVSAPGAGVLGPYYDGGYAIGAGTSFATPFIAGQCALIKALVPGISWDDLYVQVTRGVVDVYGIPENHLYIGKLGSGRFDGLETLLAATAPAGIVELSGAGGARAVPSVLIGESSAHIRWNPARAARASVLRVFDATGRWVGSRPLAASELSGGSLSWNGRDGTGRPLPSGAYLLDIVGEATELHARVFVIR